MKGVLILMAVACFPAFSSGTGCLQDSLRHRSSSFIFSYEASLVQVKDRTVSPNWYSGFMNGASIEWRKEKGIFQHRLKGFIQYGKLSHRLAMAEAETPQGELSYTAAWQCGRRFSFGFKSALWASYRFNSAWGNASGSFENIADLAPLVRYTRPFLVKEKHISFRKLSWHRPERQYLFNVFANFSILGMIARTPYAGIGDFTDGSNNRFGGENFGFYHPLSFQKMALVFELTRFHLNGANSMSVFYNWNFYRIKDPNLVKLGVNSLGISFNFLNSRKPCKIC